MLDTLESVGVLLLDVERRDEVLRSLQPDEAKLAEVALKKVARLTQSLDWKSETLLVELNCQHRTIDELQTASVADLQRCADFLDLLEEVSGYVDLLQDRRGVVIDLVDALRRAKTTIASLAGRIIATSHDHMSPRDFIRLGEIDQGARLLRMALHAERLGDRLAMDNPYALAGAAHISLARMRHLTGGRADELLGVNVAQRMREHVAGGCDACHRAWQHYSA